jgi:DNA processing protein
MLLVAAADRPLRAFHRLRRDRPAMDLQIAVAASLLPGSRSRIAAVYKDLRRSGGADSLDAVLERCGAVAAEASTISEHARRAADDAIAAARRTGAVPIPWFDARYPPLLDCIVDPPPVLWIVGEATVLDRPAVAIVGSRAASEYARQVAARLGAELAGQGVAVISGLARGVDSAAHRGCLQAGGRTVAVLGSGVDRIYPAEHGALAATVCKDGALVSELVPGTAPLPDHFPQRNRIISGISLAVVVVEASEKSGSLITARCALEQGRDVMAVPGSVLTGRNRGSHGLLKDGAKVVETADDIIQELGWPARGADRASTRQKVDSDPLLARMEIGEVYRLDELMELTAISGPRLLPRLMELELEGRVIKTAGGGFSRVSATC